MFQLEQNLKKWAKKSKKKSEYKKNAFIFKKNFGIFLAINNLKNLMEGKMQETYMERRKNERVPIQNTAKIRIIGDISAETITYDYQTAIAKNISKGGVCLTLSQKISEGNVVRVEIPINETNIIKAFCEVEWCKEQDSNGKYEIGLSFIALKEEDSEFLEKFIKENKRAI